MRRRHIPVLLVRPETIERTYVLLLFYYLGYLFFLVRRGISELRQPIATKFCSMIGNTFSFITQVQNFGCLREKRCQIFGTKSWTRTVSY